jgi:hypothetical protein
MQPNKVASFYSALFRSSSHTHAKAGRCTAAEPGYPGKAPVRKTAEYDALIPSNPRALVQIHGPLPRRTVTSSRAAEESRAQAVPFLTPVAPGLDEESVRDMDGLLFALQPVFKKSA